MKKEKIEFGELSTAVRFGLVGGMIYLGLLSVALIFWILFIIVMLGMAVVGV